MAATYTAQMRSAMFADKCHARSMSSMPEAMSAASQCAAQMNAKKSTASKTDVIYTSVFLLAVVLLTSVFSINVVFLLSLLGLISLIVLLLSSLTRLNGFASLVGQSKKQATRIAMGD
ncbi:hypothetical protein KSC_061550 [Ktedonobacter sp. SOSP1-52]|nr:hypothetical protein KSC_061550 [Ktedonobacter sp. SOSP1-52]